MDKTKYDFSTVYYTTGRAKVSIKFPISVALFPKLLLSVIYIITPVSRVTKITPMCTAPDAYDDRKSHLMCDEDYE